MPRNSSGVYSLPPAYLAVVDADIVPEQHNTPLEDIAGEITKSIATDGRTVMTGELRLFGDPTLPVGAVTKQYADRPKGTTTVALTSSNVTLTEAQCAVGRLLLTGTLTASVSVTLPTLAIGEWIVDNRTTGSYSVTIASVGAGTSLTAPQSTRTPIWHDGANIRCSADGVVSANSVTASKLAFGAWADVASASTVDLGAQTTRNVRITGTTTITSFGSTATPDNVPFQVRFAGIMAITRSASLETPNGASITTAAGDSAVIVQETTGSWRIVSYARASGIGLPAAGSGAGQVVIRDANGLVSGIVVGTSAATTSGTSYDVTGIPSTAKRITLLWVGGSTSGSSAILVQVGSGSVQTSGYNSAGSSGITNVSPIIVGSSAGFVMQNDTAADGRTYRMQIEVASGNVYVASHTLGGTTNRNTVGAGTGSVTASGAIDRLRLTTVNGTDTFDAGSLTVNWE